MSSGCRFSSCLVKAGAGKLKTFLVLAAFSAVGALAEDFSAIVSVDLHRGDVDSMGALLNAECLTSGVKIDAKEKEISVPWRGGLSLDRRCSWKLTAQAGGYWSAERVVEPSDEHEIVLSLIPTGRLTGSFSASLGDAAKVFPVRFESVPGEAGVEIPRSSLLCRVREEQWFCDLPASTLDLQLSVEGFSPHYFWDVEVQADQIKNLGSLSLVRGASLVGRVEPSVSVEEENPATISLEREITGWLGDPRDRTRVKSLSYEGEANEEGFFQLSGLTPGSYTVVVRKSGFATAQVRGVVLKAGQEEVLAETIHLGLPAELEVYVEPPIGPDGLPWILGLLKKQRAAAVLDAVFESSATLEGYWKAEDLQSGDYLLEIRDTRRQSIWYHQMVETTSRMSPLFLEVPVVPIEGSIKSGDEPLAAEIVFGSGQGVPRIPVTSNEKGYFEGFLPREGEWLIDLIIDDDVRVEQALEPVEVRRETGRKRAWVDIRVPNTRIAGEVLEDGQPTARASIAILRRGESLGRAAILRSDEEGGFELIGVVPGTLFLRAAKEGLMTRWVQVDLQEDLDAPFLRLALEKKIEVAGQVFSHAGPVPGAHVMAIPVGGDPSLAFVERATSGADGSFSVFVPAESTAVDVLVVTSGFSTKMWRMAIQKERNQPLAVFVDDPGGGTLIVGSTAQDAVLHFQGAAVKVGFLFRLLVSLGVSDMSPRDITFFRMPVGSYLLCSSYDPQAAECLSGNMIGGGLTLGGLSEFSDETRSVSAKSKGED